MREVEKKKEKNQGSFFCLIEQRRSLGHERKEGEALAAARERKKKQ